jgi:sulfatase modifying factor 1
MTFRPNPACSSHDRLMNRFSRFVVAVLTALILPRAAQTQDLDSDLQLEKSVASATVQVGDTIEFTLTAFNGGPDAATGVIIRDVLPSELTFVTASHPDNFSLNGNELTWSFAQLEVGSLLTVTYQATVTGPVAGGSVANSATVSSDAFDEDQSNNVAEVLLTVTSAGGWSDPSVMVRVDDSFCIGKYEASLEIIPSTTTVVAVSVPGVLPAVNISQVEAKQACLAAGMRLCTDSEWLRACQSAAGFVYPYGDTFQPGVCNDSGAISNAGAYSGCVTVEGAVDMVGNVHEWTDDANGTFRGGYYDDIVLNGPGCYYVTTAFGVSHTEEGLGFRCCADDCTSPAVPTLPATALYVLLPGLLAGAGLLAMMRRRRE